VSAALKTDKDVGKLLYHIATKLKAKKFQSILVEYVAKKKLLSEAQVTG